MGGFKVKKIIRSRGIIFIFCALIFIFPLSSSAEILFSFVGQMDLLNKQMKLMVLDAPSETSTSLNEYPHFSLLDKQPENSLLASVERATPSDYRLSFNVEHFKTFLFDLSSNIESSIEVIEPSAGAGRSINGKFWSQYSLIDYKPGGDISGEFEIRDGKVYIHSMSLGDLTCQGYVSFLDPYQVDMAVNLKEMNLDSFLDFWIKNKEFQSSGTVSGEIQITGDFHHPFLKGNLAASEGTIKKLNFNKLFLNAQGPYPQLEITKLTIHQNDGLSFEMEGPFDLSDRKNFKKQIDALTMSPLVQHSESESQWTIKHLEDREAGSTEIKYHLRKDKNAGSFSTENSDMLGIERTIDF